MFRLAFRQVAQGRRWCPTSSAATVPTFQTQSRSAGDVARPSWEDMPYLHHRTRDPNTPREKFKSPIRRASKLLHELSIEKVQESKAAKPAVFEVDYAVGDAIECKVIEKGGPDSTEQKVVRGVVIGKFNKGIDTKVLIRDVVMGTIVERLIPLHSPMLKSIKLLEKNFVYKGRRKVKRAKLYFLRDRNPNESRVTKSKN